MVVLPVLVAAAGRFAARFGLVQNRPCPEESCSGKLPAQPRIGLMTFLDLMGIQSP